MILAVFYEWWNILKNVEHDNEKCLNISTIDELIKLWVKKEAKFKFDGRKKFVPSDIDVSELNFYVDEIFHNNKKYYFAAYSSDYSDVKVNYLI